MGQELLELGRACAAAAGLVVRGASFATTAGLAGKVGKSALVKTVNSRGKVTVSWLVKLVTFGKVLVSSVKLVKFAR